MKVSVTLAALVLALCLNAGAAVDFDTMSVNTWAQITTYHQFPGWGVETHLAYDTSGYMYMLGSCSYGGAAGGTHNNDIFRFDVKKGLCEEILTCGTNPWPGGCQGGQVYDRTRHCIWFGPGANSVCRTGVQFFPGQAYYGGLYRMSCPTAPIGPTLPTVTVEMITSNSLGGGYYEYDPVNDLVISVLGGAGCRLDIYDVKNGSIYSRNSPFNNYTDRWRTPVCFDTKRNATVITRWGSDANALTDIWLYDAGADSWSSITPNNVPPIKNVPLIYEPVADKYVLIGTYPDGNSDEHPEIWVYSYDSNSWTEIPRGSRAYNASDRTSSTWPPLRVYPGSFGYCVKNGVIANWGGLNTSGSGSDGNTKQPIWAFKLADGGTGSEKAALRSAGPVLTVSPNPFNGVIKIAGSGQRAADSFIKILIFDVKGKVVDRLSATSYQLSAGLTWNASAQPPGVYLLSARADGKVLTKRLFLVK
jgi:hypothetical protein